MHLITKFTSEDGLTHRWLVNSEGKEWWFDLEDEAHCFVSGRELDAEVDAYLDTRYAHEDEKDNGRARSRARNVIMDWERSKREDVSHADDQPEQRSDEAA